ncbi:MAG TPA: sensor histidine kinase, partial [Ruminococcaceae bacterium]|nr:sensor histidine kinase [Oscillospiraceae bacterium]
KGFTGTNGRIGRRSTGFGLYLCRRLCKKMGLGIFADSQEGKGTSVTLSFPKSSMYL